MNFTERTILKLLLEEAKRDGYAVHGVAPHPPEGEDGDTIAGAPLLLAEIVKHMDTWAANFQLEFRAPGKQGFWLRWIPGNREDAIHDYQNSLAANNIIHRVYKEIRD